MPERYFPHEEAVTLVAATAQDITVPGPNKPGYPAYRLDFIAHDEGKLAGITLQDVRVKVIPKGHPDALGGSVYHSFYAVPTPGTNNRHMLPCGGIVLDANEDVDLTLYSGTGGTIRLRVERTLLTHAPRR